jgi:gliding motility-associated-like protein
MMKRNYFYSLKTIFFVAALLLVTKTSFAQNTIDAGPDDTICPPGSATLTASVTIGSGGIPGTGLALSDDQWSSSIPLGFNFTFFGNTYSSILVGSNNILTFDVSQAGGYCQWPIGNAIPSSSDPMNSIMCPWEDLLPAPNNEVYATIGTAPNRIFVVSYCSSPMFSCVTTPFTGCILLYEGTNVIETHVSDKFLCSNWNGGAAIHGVQNSTGTVAFVVPGRNYPTQWTASNDAWRFTPTGPASYTITNIPFAPIILNSAVSAIQWSNGSWNVGSGTTITVFPTTTTTYYATLGDCGGTVTDSVTVVVSTIDVNAGNDTTVCPGAPVQLNATSTTPPITSWTWTPTTGLSNPNIPNPIASPTVTTVYTVTASNGQCTTSDDVTIIVNNSAFNYTAAQNDPVCFSDCNGSATVTVTSGSGPFTYTWSPSGGNGATASNLCAGTYTCVITASVGCTGTQTFNITQPNQLTVSLSTAPTDCNDSTGTATASPTGGTGPYTYLWNDGQSTQTATGLWVGTDSVVVMDVNGCLTTQTVSVIMATPPVAAFTATPPGIIQGQTTQLDASGGLGNTYLWSPVTDLSCTTCANPVATPQQTTTYCVVVSDSTTGCVDSTCLRIDVEIPCTSGGLDKLLPNAFSPNGDGTNDAFCIPYNVCISTFELKIYDRWGEKVFETNNMQNCWDGTYKGEMLNRGLYVYYLDAVLSTGDAYHRQGNISLIK